MRCQRRVAPRQRLTPAGASYSAAAFTAARGGVWLLAGNGALSEARLASGNVTQVATLDTAASALIWSPSGATAAVTLGNRLALWSDTTGLTTLAQGVTASVAPAWASDGASIAVAQGQNVVTYRLSNSAATQVAGLTGAAHPLALAWAGDGHNIAIAESEGMLLAPSNGAGPTLLTAHLADDAALSWSVAR